MVVRPNLHLKGFKFLRKLGSGGFATSYLYEDCLHEFSNYVVVKVPHEKKHEQALIQGDLVSLAALRNQQNIVQYYNVRLAGDRYVLLMEYVEGLSLRDLLCSEERRSSLSVEKIVKYILGIARGLGIAHGKKMVHRDIKPDNIIIENASDSPKILDFGITSLTGDSMNFDTVLYRRTAAYTPLEILLEGKGDHRVDIFALGITFYELVTGELPYFHPGITEHQRIEMMRTAKVPSPRQKSPWLPCYVEDVIRKAIEPNKERRYEDIPSLIKDLELPPEIKIAEEHQGVGEFRKAERILRSLVETRPNDTRGHIGLASLLNRCQRFSEANRILEQAVAVDPLDPSLHMRIGVNMDKVKRYQEATEHLEIAYDCAKDPRMKRKIKLLQRTSIKLRH